MKATDFYSDTPRIMGTEMEHNITVVQGEFRSGIPNPLRALAPYIADEIGMPHLADRNSEGKLVHPYQSQGQGLLPTGDRMYMDIGEHAEFSTAEFWTASGVVGREFTGGNLLFTGLARALGAGSIEEFKLYKNVASNGKYWGYHENYLGLRRLDIVKQYAGPLVTHLVTRQIFAGAGDVNDHGEFFISQKMPGISTELEGSASGSCGRRPILDVNRDEPHAKREEWRRIHVASGDPHLNPRSSWLQLITTSIVARLAEAGVDLEDLRIKNSVKEAHKIVQDLDLQHELAVGSEQARKMTALQIQQELHQRAEALNDRSPLPAEEQLGLEIWGMVLQQLEAQEESVTEWVEWLRKYELLSQTRERHDLKWSDPIVQAVNREWASLNPEKGYGLRRAFRRPIPMDVMTGYGDLTPPPGRPSSRAQFIRMVQDARREHGYNRVSSFYNWDGCKVRMAGDDQPWIGLDWPDPYGVDEIICASVQKSSRFWLGEPA